MQSIFSAPQHHQRNVPMQMLRSNYAQKRHIVLVVAAAVILVVLVLGWTTLRRSSSGSTTTSVSTDGEASIHHDATNTKNEDDADVKPHHYQSPARQKAQQLLNELKYAISVTDLAMDRKLLRNALNFPIRYHRDRERDGDDRRPRTLIFVGDSHALRSFRWAVLMLYRAQALRPDGKEYVTEELVSNLDSGVHHETMSSSVSIELIPNSARLRTVQFRRAVFLDEAANEIGKIGDEMASQKAEAFIAMSVGSWDIIRPTLRTHKYTLDSLFEEHQFRAKKKKNNNNNNRLDGGGGGGDASASPSSGDISEILERTLARWKQSCERFNDILNDGFGGGGGGNNGGNLIGSRVQWRWASVPNCSAPRFQVPRANAALSTVCPRFVENWWSVYEHMARDVVHPEAHPPQQGGDGDGGRGRGSYIPFGFYDENNMRNCRRKVDGVHPSHFCAAKEAAAVLLRAAS